jgi:hypothetical protein
MKLPSKCSVIRLALGKRQVTPSASPMACAPPEDFIERFSERIRALSANQELLVRGERTGVKQAMEALNRSNSSLE